jgi:hypothetical protein
LQEKSTGHPKIFEEKAKPIAGADGGVNGGPQATPKSGAVLLSSDLVVALCLAKKDR